MGNLDIGLALVLCGISLLAGFLGTRVNDQINKYQSSLKKTDRNWALLFIGLFCALCVAFILMGFGILL